MTYTITVTKEQKEILQNAVEKYSQLHLGQTTTEMELAVRLDKLIKNLYLGNNNLTDK